MTETRPDRLSALIRRFRISAAVHPAADDGGSRPNLLLFGGDVPGRPGEEVRRVVFFPRGVASGDGPEHAFACAATVSPVVAATVDMGGAANPVALALPECVSIRLDESAALQDIAGMLLEEALAPRCGGRAVIERLCEVLVIRLLRHLLEAGRAEAGLLAGLADPNISLALVAMHDEPARRWRLTELAAVAGMSRTAFANRFRDLVGQTPGDYLSAWRLTLARGEIGRGDSLKSVAAKVGFSGPAALSRAFSRRYGVSPRRSGLRAGS